MADGGSDDLLRYLLKDLSDAEREEVLEAMAKAKPKPAGRRERARSQREAPAWLLRWRRY
jgi:hypothetical protein